MCLPQFTSEGVLPEGIYELNLNKIKEVFCSFGNKKKREQLFNILTKYISFVNKHDVAKEIFVDGSFITNKPEPDDMDIAIFYDYEYNNCDWLNLINDDYIRSNFKGLQVFTNFLDSYSKDLTIDFLSGVKENPKCKKGLVKVVL